MRLIVKLKQPAQIVEFLELMEGSGLQSKNQKYLEYLVTSPRGPNQLYFSTEDTISRLLASPCVESVVEAPKFIDFNANDFE